MQESRLRADLRGISGTSFEERPGETDPRADTGDHARRGYESVVDEGIVKSRRTLRLAIEGALQRIATRTYGRCLQCDEEISREVLEKRPTEILCMGCQETESADELERKAVLRRQIEKGAYLVCL